MQNAALTQLICACDLITGNLQNNDLWTDLMWLGLGDTDMNGAGYEARG